MLGGTITYREPSKRETVLLKFLGRQACLDSKWLNDLNVSPMNDGGMGSLTLRIAGVATTGVFSHEGATVQFRDKDDILVVAGLYMDSNNIPFELDSWKVNDQKLIEIPLDITRFSPFSPENGAS